MIGRRRVGKTFLVNRVYGDRIAFSVTGLQNAPKREQLQNFAYQLAAYSGDERSVRQPSNWLEAFQFLRLQLSQQLGDEKLVVFLDELPWLATPKSGFLRGLSFFWNSWAVHERIVVVICGSAASWMIQKVVRNKGGLHNRITKRIYLAPFDLSETRDYLASRNVRLDHYQTLQLYMAMGGIPHYLKEVQAGKSATQNIDAICFSPGGLLRNEFTALYPSLFEEAERHISVIRTLAARHGGLNRSDLIRRAGLSDGGRAGQVLQDLVSSGFITLYPAYDDKKKNSLYRLTDEYSRFYLKFIENNREDNPGTWTRLSQTQTWQSWSGYAFESICLKYIDRIRAAMSIGGIYSRVATYTHRESDKLPGFQIDLLLDRNDQTINLFEVKFLRETLAIDRAFNIKLQQRAGYFRAATGTTKQLLTVLITTFPVVENAHKHTFIDQFLTMEALFTD